MLFHFTENTDILKCQHNLIWQARFGISNMILLPVKTGVRLSQPSLSQHLAIGEDKM